MGALGEVGTKKILSPNCGSTILQVKTAATVVTDDTFTLDLTKHGCRNIHGILGFTTDGSAMVAEQPTTSVTSGVLTVTVTGTAVTSARVYYIFAY